MAPAGRRSSPAFDTNPRAPASTAWRARPMPSGLESRITLASGICATSSPTSSPVLAPRASSSRRMIWGARSCALPSARPGCETQYRRCSPARPANASATWFRSSSSVQITRMRRTSPGTQSANSPPVPTENRQTSSSRSFPEHTIHHEVSASSVPVNPLQRLARLTPHEWYRASPPA